MTASDGGTCPRCGGRHRSDQDCRERSRVGEVADKYRIGRLIGQGGMGTVYEAQHIFVGRRFAVKFLHAELARQEELLARFRREAQAAGQLESENIAQVVDFGHAHDGVPFIVMEFLQGEDLARFLAREGPLPLTRAAALVIQACRGLDAAHAAGIVHRDLKPENLFLSKRGDSSDLLKILDFGIAKLTGAADGPGASVTHTGATVGTPYYMPPEQARGEKELDHRADVYAMGVILFEMLTGQKPHPGDSYNAILYHILTQPPVELTALRPGLPAELCALVQSALASVAGDRPKSAMALARGLSPFAGPQLTPLRSQFELRAAARAAAVEPPAPSALGATAPSPFSPQEGPAQPRTMRNRLLAAAGLVALAVAVAVLLRTPAPPPGGGAAPTAPAAMTTLGGIPAASPSDRGPGASLPPDADLNIDHAATNAVEPSKGPQILSDRPPRSGPGRSRGQSRGAHTASASSSRTAPPRGESLSKQPIGDNQAPPGHRRPPTFERNNPYQ